eukprot:3089575-Pyramimonas_sp.AAC.1
MRRARRALYAGVREKDYLVKPGLLQFPLGPCLYTSVALSSCSHVSTVGDLLHMIFSGCGSRVDCARWACSRCARSRRSAVRPGAGLGVGLKTAGHGARRRAGHCG